MGFDRNEFFEEKLILGCEETTNTQCLMRLIATKKC